MPGHFSGRNEVLRSLPATIQRSWLSAAIALFILPVHIVVIEAASLSLDFNENVVSGTIPRPWKVRQNTGRADLSIDSENGEHLLHLRCRESSFAVERDISVDVSASPYMTWTWKVLKVPLRGDVRERRHNDQALQLLVAFESRKVLSYVWDSTAPEGTTTDESIGWPVNLQVRVIVVKSGTADIGEWITHTRNIYEDYINTFHEVPSRLKGVRIQTNTQYTKDVAEGLIKGIAFGKEVSVAF